MPSFRTQYEEFKVETQPGSKLEPIYSSSYDKEGTLVLEVVGERDIYADIQSHAESVDIHSIIKRYTLGDTSVLSRVQGFYDDVSELPKTYQEVLNSVIKSEQFFDSLPVEQKQKFDNNFAKFMIATGDPNFIDIFFGSSETFDDKAEPDNNTEDVNSDES